MAGPFLVPIKNVEIHFDDNANQNKIFLEYCSFVLYFTLSEAYSLSKA